jgi:hypothetical protein
VKHRVHRSPVWPHHLTVPLRRRAPRQRLNLLGDVAQHQGRALAEHRELLAGDLELGLAQPGRVIETDGCQDRDARAQDIGRVEATAEPRLDDPHLHPGLGEGHEGRGRGGLELGDPLTLGEVALGRRQRLDHPLRGRGERPGIDLGTPDPHPLRPALGMRREIGACRAPPRLHERRGHHGHRGLPVGPDDVDRLELVLGIAQLPKQRRDPLEAEPPADRI